MFKLNRLLSLGVLAALCGQAMAQADAGSAGSGIGATGERKPGFVNLGGVFVTPTIDVLAGQNNNVTSAGGSLPRITSSVLSVRPGVIADIERRGDKYQASYFGQYDQYAASKVDNINNHDFRAVGQNYLTPRADVNWGLRYADQYDPRGLNPFLTLGEPVRYKTSEAKARGGYGAEGAPGRVEVYGGVMQKRYQNGLPLTLAYNLDMVNAGATFYYRVAPKTRLLFDISQTKNKYPDGNSQLGNTESKYLLGATWDFLAATSGTVKAGYFDKKADNPVAVRSLSGLNIEGLINWKPLTYTELIGTLNRGALEASVGATGFAIGTGGSLTWKHAWRSYARSTVGISQQKFDFTGSTRSDKVSAVNAGFMYDLTRSLGLGVELGYTKRDSTDPLFTYDQRKILFKVAASL